MYESFKEEDIHDICEKYIIRNYTINDDGSIDVNDDVHLGDYFLEKLPLRFRNVSGYFYCSENNLINLEGSPIFVGGDFNVDNNELLTLEGSPRIIKGGFYCNNNRLKSLKGSPERIEGIFNCDENYDLISLEGFNNATDFSCEKCPINDVYKLFKDIDKIELFNDYDCITEINGAPAIIIDRLNDFLNEVRVDIDKVGNYISV